MSSKGAADYKLPCVMQKKSSIFTSGRTKHQSIYKIDEKVSYMSIACKMLTVKILLKMWKIKCLLLSEFILHI